MSAWLVSERIDLNLSRLRRSSLSRREREGGAQRRKGEGVKLYDEARTGAAQRARQLRRASTDAEKCLWRELRLKLPQHKWRRQMPIGPYFVDFACFADRLVIELDGGQHANAVLADETRTRFIEAQGYGVLRFWNNDALNNTDGVLEQIMERIAASPSHSCAAGPSLSHGRGNAEACQ
jgi:very-short-patch-repair endonuclease